jgi:HTH-type transcriptional regulator/antitoxin HipB
MQPITDSPQIGALLVARRKALRLTQTQVAAKLGLSQNRLSELESQPAALTVAQLLALSDVLGLTLKIGAGAGQPDAAAVADTPRRRPRS